MNSFRKINYSLRPGKHAERKMMGELFRRLSAFAPLEDYRYVGLGSVWFSDFSLFHKSLGIGEMISIEQAAGAKKRFEANRPFDIKMIFQKTNEALPDIDWTKRSIVWLDYDGVLDNDILLDARVLGGRCSSGSIVAMSVNCTEAKQIGESDDDGSGPSALTRFKEAFGRERAPDSVAADDLIGKRFARLSRTLIHNELRDAVAARNAAGSEEVTYTPIVDFSYRDDAPMTTTVGLLHNAEEADRFEKCHFGELDFLRDNPSMVDIQVPMLTTKEVRYLESQLPKIGGGALSLDGDIPEKEARAFKELYRYLPNFATLAT